MGPWRLDRGQLTLDGHDIAFMGSRGLACRVELFYQYAATEMNVAVQDVVMMGLTQPDRNVK